MLKPLPNFRAELTMPMPSGAIAAQINNSGADSLKLASGDWAYAAVADGVSYEIVRITGRVGNTISIDRGIDDSGAHDFSIGAKLTYVLPLQAVRDIADEVVNKVNVTGSGAIKVSRTGDFQWNVHADKLTMVSKHPDIQVLNVYPNFFITKTP